MSIFDASGHMRTRGTIDLSPPNNQHEKNDMLMALIDCIHVTSCTSSHI